MNDFAFSSIKELREKLDKKEISTAELVDSTIARFKKYDGNLGSALEVFERDTILKNVSSTGLLASIPGLIKDNICQEGHAVTCASKILAGYKAPYDATVVTRLKAAGALSVGRANMDEFAMGSSTETSAYQKTKNPWDVSRVPGGSSGGSATAVAAGLVPWSLGTDTGGSIRQPAALCGIVGIKPTYGLVSRYGLIAYGSSIDQIGPMTRSVYDNALVLSVMAGHDACDSTSRNVQPQNYTQELTGKIKTGLTIGVIENALYAEGMDEDVVNALETSLKQFEALGATIKRIKLPTMDYAAAIYFMLSRAEAASNLARFDGVKYGYRSKHAQNLADMYAHTRSEGFGYEVKRRILIGNYVLSAGHADEYYASAKKVQGMMRHEFVEALKTVDVLFSPVAPSGAFTFGAFDADKLKMDLQDYFTASANLTGLPALVVPCGMTKNNLPIGLQLIGSELSEGLLYQTAYAYEQATDWHTKHPKL